MSALTHLLLSKFDSVEPIYLNSFKSCADEDNGVVNEDNVKDLVRINEETLPNDASLHKGVLLLLRVLGRSTLLLLLYFIPLIPQKFTCLIIFPL